MSNGKIIYPPISSVALSLDGAHYLSRATPANLVPNGNFEAGDVDWGLYVDGTAAATKTIGTGDPYEGTKKAKITITAPGAGPANIQFYSQPFSLVQGKKYMVFLRAKSADAHFPLVLWVRLFSSPYTAYGTFAASLTKAYQLYSFSFVAPVTSDNIILCFYLGGWGNSEVYLDGITVAEKIFDFGTDDFGVDALLQIDSEVADSECWIAAKGAADLANDAGWHWYYKPGSRRLGLRLNDGGVTPVVVETADNQIPALGTNFWGRLELDRTNGLARFYANGALVASGDISAVTGSLDNAADLKVCACDASTHRHQGSLDFLRFDLGRILPAAWHEEEWYRIKYGCRRLAQDFLAFWTWDGESLADLSAEAYELTWQGGGDPVYAVGWPGSAGLISYVFGVNFNFGDKPGYLDLDDRQRMLDASDFTYPHPNPKQTFLWQFKYILPEQRAAFAAAYESKQPVKLYRNADRPQIEGTFRIITYPLQESVFTNVVNAELDVEQV